MITAKVAPTAPDLKTTLLSTIVSAADARAAKGVGIEFIQQAYDALVGSIDPSLGNADLSRRGLAHDPSDRIEKALLAYEYIPDSVRALFVADAAENPQLKVGVKDAMLDGLREAFASFNPFKKATA